MFYPALVFREGRHWLAEFPDAPGCQTFADSETALMARAAEALEGWLEAHLVDGQAPPAPKRSRRAEKGQQIRIVRVSPALAVAVQLRWARARAKLTQAEVAKLAGVSQQQVAKLERPGENPTIATLEKVTRALGATLDISVRRPAA